MAEACDVHFQSRMLAQFWQVCRTTYLECLLLDVPVTSPPQLEPYSTPELTKLRFSVFEPTFPLQTLKRLPAHVSRGGGTRNAQEKIDTENLHQALTFWKRYVELKHREPSTSLSTLTSADFDSTPSLLPSQLPCPFRKPSLHLMI